MFDIFNARWLIVLSLLCHLLFSFFRLFLSNQQRKKIFPEILNGIYDQARYAEFLAHRHFADRAPDLFLFFPRAVKFSSQASAAVLY